MQSTHMCTHCEKEKKPRDLRSFLHVGSPTNLLQTGRFTSCVARRRKEKRGRECLGPVGYGRANATLIRRIVPPIAVYDDQA